MSKRVRHTVAGLRGFVAWLMMVAVFLLLTSLSGVHGDERVARFVDGIFLYSNWDAPWVTLDTCLDMSVVRVEVPDSVTLNGRSYPVAEIGSEAFNGCRNLMWISLPGAGLLKGAFLNCPRLQVIEIRSPNPPVIGIHHFYRASWHEVFERYMPLSVVLVVPPGSEEAYRHAYGWCEFKTIQSSPPTIDDWPVDEIDIRINQLEGERQKVQAELDRIDAELDALRSTVGRIETTGPLNP